MRPHRLVGILTNRDIRFAEGDDFTRPVSEFMTGEGLVTAPVGTTLEQAKRILQKHRIEKLPLVDARHAPEGPDHGQGYSEEARLSQRRHRLAAAACCAARRWAWAQIWKRAWNCSWLAGWTWS